MKLLAIESSCDETAAAVVENGRRVLSSVINSQVEEHRQYGGVVPEIASRRHTAVSYTHLDVYKRQQLPSKAPPDGKPLLWESGFLFFFQRVLNQIFQIGQGF